MLRGLKAHAAQKKTSSLSSNMTRKMKPSPDILKKAQVKNKIAGIIFELTFQDTSFRLYTSGKAIFRSIKNREELNQILKKLLL